MDKKNKIEKRIEEVRKANDQINNKLNEIASLREKLIQEALINNGRLLELESQLKNKE